MKGQRGLLLGATGTIGQATARALCAAGHRVTALVRPGAGKPFLIFGDGRLTACKPIADANLAGFLVRILDDPAAERRILPIGGRGPAITPRDQAMLLFELTGRPPCVRRVPVSAMDGIVAVLSGPGRVSPHLTARAEPARIGRSYATESMLVRDPQAGRYDAEATPEFGTRTLRDHDAAWLRGEVADDRGTHAVF